MYTRFFLLFFIGLCVACDPCDVDPTMMVPVNFRLVDQQDNNLIASKDQPLEVYYMKGNHKRNIRVDIWPDDFRQYHVSSYDFVLTSASGVKTFYLKTNGDIDTIYVDAKKTKSRPCKNGGGYDLKKLLFNGKPVEKVRGPYYEYYRLVKTGAANGNSGK